MATAVEPSSISRKVSKSIRPDAYERFLAVAAAVLLVFVIAALVRGYPHWTEAKPLVWAHLLTIILALALTPFLLLQKRGSRRHRQLGWAWALAMFATAVISLGIRESGPSGGWSPIHVLSGITIVGVPLAVWRARQHNVPGHRLGIRITVTGALVIAGFFTFPFGRMLGRWLFG